MPATFTSFALAGIAAMLACVFLVVCGPLLLALERVLAISTRIGS